MTSRTLPVITFTDDITFHLNGDSISVVHVGPAHTDGDVIVHRAVYDRETDFTNQSLDSVGAELKALDALSDESTTSSLGRR